MNPYFSRGEFEERYRRAGDLMRAAGLSALFLTSDRNLYYLSGHQPFYPWHSATRPVLMLAPADGEPLMLTHHVWHGAAVRDSWFPDVRGYGGLAGVPLDMIVAAFRERGLAQGRIGAELGLEQRLGMPVADFAALQDALPAAEWVDASELLWELRLIKSQTEIEYIRQACRATMHGFATAFPALRPGMTQEEVTRRLQAGVLAGGAEPTFTVPTWGPDTYNAMAVLPKPEPISAGDLICVDLGANYRGYWCDFARAVSLGEPPAETKELWEAIHRVTMRGVEAVRPGIPMGALVEACAGEVERQGLELQFSAGRIGHGIGLCVTEPPSVTADSELVLQPGMTITLEPGIVGPAGAFVVEQNFAVTDAGVDLLSAGPWKIWVA